MDIVIKVNSTYNNTIVSALYRGKILKTISTGSLGFKKAKRASTLAAQTCGEALGSWLLLLNKSLNLGLAKQSLNKGLNTETIGSDFEYALLQEAKKKLVLSGGKKLAQTNQTISAKKTDNAVKTLNTQSSGHPKGEKVKEDSNSKIVSKFDTINQVSLLVSGVGYGKFGVIRGLSKLGIKIKTISDVTAVPHNGCKPPKMRRK